MRQMIWLGILELALLFGSSVKGKRTCEHFPLGLANSNVIPDSRFTAPSILNDFTQPFYGRIGEDRGNGAWCASNQSSNHWLQVDLMQNFIICGVRVQGGTLGYVRKFQMAFSTDGGTFSTFNNVFTRSGALGEEEEEFHSIRPFQEGRYIRILPTVFVGTLCLKFELYGFPGPDITCTLEGMVVTFKVDSYIDLELSSMHLKDETCLAVSENATHIVFHIPLDRCGTQRFPRDDDILYTNVVIRKIDATGALVTAQMDMAFTVECFYDRDFFLDGAVSGVATNASITDEISGTESSRGGRSVYNHFFSWVLVLGLPAVWLCLLGVVG